MMLVMMLMPGMPVITAIVCPSHFFWHVHMSILHLLEDALFVKVDASLHKGIQNPQYLILGLVYDLFIFLDVVRPFGVFFQVLLDLLV